MTRVVTVTDNLPDGVTSIIAYQGGMEVDADGAPNAYCPKGGGLDAIKDAGHPGNWFGVETDTGEKDGEPFIQGPNDPCPECYVSGTALVDHTKPRHDPNRYVNAAEVPYISVPRELKHLVGCLCVVLYKSFLSPGIVAEVGPEGKYGEASIMMAKVNDIPSSPISGGVEAGVTYIIFEGTSKGWPRDYAEFSAAAQQFFEQMGGVDRVNELFA